MLALSCVEKKDENKTPKINREVNTTIIHVPTKNNLGKINNLHSGCGFNYNLDKPELILSLPSQREINEIQNILSYSGIPMNFEVYSANIENAVATIINNKRYIIFDPRLLGFADRNSNSYWSSMSILAHEIGHHLAGHTMKNDIDSHKRELEADKFSGFILYKMGATIEQATYTISMLGTEQDTDSHPSKYKRIEAITNGWTEASNQRYKGAIPPPPNDNANDFPIYEVNSLIREEYRTAENSDIWYGEYDFLYGIITEVSADLSEAKVHIVKSSQSFVKEFRDIKNEDWTIYLDQTSWGGENEMSHSASMNLPYLMIPGRRIKFAMVEGYPGCGTSANGMWSFTYLEALDGSSF